MGPPPSFFRSGVSPAIVLALGITARSSAPGRRTDRLTHRQSDTPPSHSAQNTDRRPRAAPQAAADLDAETVPATQRTPGTLIIGSFTPHRTHTYTNHRLIYAASHSYVPHHVLAYSCPGHTGTLIVGSFTPHRAHTYTTHRLSHASSQTDTNHKHILASPYTAHSRHRRTRTRIIGSFTPHRTHTIVHTRIIGSFTPHRTHTYTNIQGLFLPPTYRYSNHWLIHASSHSYIHES